MISRQSLQNFVDFYNNEFVADRSALKVSAVIFSYRNPVKIVVENKELPKAEYGRLLEENEILSFEQHKNERHIIICPELKDIVLKLSQIKRNKGNVQYSLKGLIETTARYDERTRLLLHSYSASLLIIETIYQSFYSQNRDRFQL